MSRAFLLGAMLALCPAIATAQATTGLNPVYRRAQAMVNDGNAVAGRALVDSMISVAAPGSNEYAEGIYWRAVLAATAAEAEMDYRRVVVDYPRSPRVEDALIRLAQLEIARANFDGALQHLNKLVAEHPESPARARAGYWMARALFDKNDIQGGCVATADALARTTENEAELRNQITYLNQRCAGVVIAGPPTVAPAPAAVPVATTSPPETVATTPTETTTPAVTTLPRAPATVPATPAPVRESVVIPPAPPPAETQPASAETVAATPAGPRAFSVQVAAYNAKSQADAMVARLKKNGYEARVDGTTAPYRVRIGRYATQAQASAVQRSLKAKQIAGFVVQADTR